MSDNLQIAKEAETKETLEEKADILMKIQGNMRGELLRNNFIYLKQREGEKAVKTMEDRLKELGYPLAFKDIKTYRWYKDPFCALFMLIFKEQFQWKEEDIVEAGKFAFRHSFIIRIAIKYLVSTKIAFWAAPKLWNKNVDYGEVEGHELNESGKYLIFRFKKWALHPLVCLYIKGYLMALFILIGKNNVQAEETKCVFKGDSCHEYKIRWE